MINSFIRLAQAGVILLIAAGVQAKDRNPTTFRPATAGNGADGAALQTIAKGHFSGCGERADYIIRSKQEWADLWSRVGGGAPLPSVDFNRETVLAACMGSQGSGGYSTEIRNVAGENPVSVDVAEMVPSPTCGVTAVMSQPFHVVKVRRRLKTADFRHSQIIRECPGADR